MNLASFEEGLGRVMYVVSALEYKQPFLAPLYRFATMHPRSTTRRMRACMRFILNSIAKEVSETRHTPCDSVLRTRRCSSRVDAPACGDRTGVGGWLPNLDERGNAAPGKSRRFSLEVRPEDSRGFSSETGNGHRSSRLWRRSQYCSR